MVNRRFIKSKDIIVKGDFAVISIKSYYIASNFSFSTFCLSYDTDTQDSKFNLKFKLIFVIIY